MHLKVNLFLCPKCSSEMRVIAVTENSDSKNNMIHSKNIEGKKKK